jgi:hypothetical protein
MLEILALDAFNVPDMANQRLFRLEHYVYLRLDLHGCSVRCALAVGEAKIRECYGFGIRFLEIVHGHDARSLSPTLRNVVDGLPELVDSTIDVTMDFGVVKRCSNSQDVTGFIVVIAQNPLRKKVLYYQSGWTMSHVPWEPNAVLSPFIADISRQRIDSLEMKNASETSEARASKVLNVEPELEERLGSLSERLEKTEAPPGRVVFPQFNRPVYKAPLPSSTVKRRDTKNEP